MIELLARGEIVTVEKSSSTPPLELPVRAEWLGGEVEKVGVISRTSSYRIRIFDERQTKNLEARRKGLTELIQRLTYPLADGMRWIPKKAQPLLERERTRLVQEARELIKGLVGCSASDFARSRREAIEQDANEMYRKVHEGKGHLPTRALNLILRDLEDRYRSRIDGKSTSCSKIGNSSPRSNLAQLAGRCHIALSSTPIPICSSKPRSNRTP